MGYLGSGVYIFILLLIFLGLSSAANTTGIGSETVQEGKISPNDLHADRSTTDWAGFYGTFKDGVGLYDRGDVFYNWDISYIEGTILATDSENEFSGNIDNLENISSSSNADEIPGIPNQGIEKASNTFNDSNLMSPKVSSLDKTVNTNLSFGKSSAFFTNYLYEYDDGTDQHPVYATDTFQDETSFNGVSPVNYQILVGTEGSNGQSSGNFEFYAVLD